MNPIQILIVEDEQLVADDLRETLEHLGYGVPALVASGEEAIFMAGNLRPDLVLMDIRLEGKIDGIEASFAIQSRFDLPVVYLTANADRATLERAKASHPFGYILKPFDERILATTIEIAISRHQTEVEVKKALIAAKNSQQIAESKNQMKSQHLYMAAHEFRNPLTTIKLSAEMLNTYGKQMSEEKKQKHIDRIESATDSLTNLLENILTLGRAEADNFVLNPTLIEVVSFCEEIVESLRLTLKEHYEISFVTNTQSFIACLDEQLLWHLLNNLLSNAVKYSPRGSTILLGLTCDESSVYFQIKDQGVGIPLEFQAKLFEPFQRAANVATIPGTGLGLAIVKQCVDLHQGKISIDSTLGQGTSFLVRLPLKVNSISA
ncbi:response regulator receiver sensor signal transduction histidine kinase [Trichormus variabilis ATCC 29413]|uniref:histidine kinase n=2 Tax=Anabaena variabilis TaxID=264691 RepID=Q3MH44_TRIV2|nr:MULTISPECIES: ATP-binding protein [Nostocaceae]ABA19692.1 response regulator receiver sensor signal transduction histidine kinase [Trichormus variabilis ATCC 29413]MBC1213310.1 response regulator [Trichormus variabilis ARAD]MBC1258635.1 response regulator [Trichormus variabilis V5]MBC1265985.1 response regulator [Trichormus variabilis FSR]MBC1302930.1 response regulator [Trichormus variabilis N2B]